MIAFEARLALERELVKVGGYIRRRQWSMAIHVVNTLWCAFSMYMCRDSWFCALIGAGAAVAIFKLKVDLKSYQSSTHFKRTTEALLAAKTEAVEDFYADQLVAGIRAGQKPSNDIRL